MPGFLGIDHPLVLVRDIGRMLALCQQIGFTMTPVTQHPWGTSTSVAVFDRCLLEIMSVNDETLLDQRPAGDFRFGRTVAEHLAAREGISLTALHSTDALADSAQVAARGIACQGTIEFGRDIVLPDGNPDRTATTLRILFDPALPRLSHFVCQQHRPDLIYVPRWMQHKNGVTGIGRVTIMAEPADQPRVCHRFTGLYGADRITPRPDGFTVQTGNGVFTIATKAAVQAEYGPLPAALAEETQPCNVAMHFRTPALDAAATLLDAAEIAYHRSGQTIQLHPIAAFGNVALVFDASIDQGN